MIKRRLCLLSVLTFVAVLLSARQVIPFNEKWEFKKGPFPTDSYLNAQKWNTSWEAVELPHTWNAKDMQLRVNSFYEGEAYYRKSYFFPEELKEKRIFLRFEGVGACAEVYINGTLVTTHKGGYSAFACEIGRELRPGQQNEIVVKADNKARPDVIPVNHSLFGVYGGIYRPVWLVITDPVNIAVTDHASPGVYISQENVSKQKADITVKVKLSNGTLHPKPVTIENTLYTHEGKKILSRTEPVEVIPGGLRSYTTRFTVKNPRLWQGRQDPYLYRITTRILEDGKEIDRIDQPLGIRHYEIVAGKGFYLNGKKYPMYGVTRHQDWWEIGSALKNEHHDADLATIMDIGATTVRFAHYQQSDYLYSRCDTLGLIIWAEIPFVNRVTGQEAENAQTQLREMIRQSFNHPSIYVWGLHNEVYRPHQYTTELTQTLHDLAKTEDPGRYTVAVNGYGHMEHPVNLQADIQGMNRYFGWYEKKIQDIKPWIEELETTYPQEMFMLTEYGADANIHHQTENLGDALNWTKPFYPETFQTKTHEYQWSVIKDHPYIIASYLWNTFDFAVPMWERGGVPARNMKGLVTIDRKLKKDSYFWYKANWSSDPVLYITERRNNDREKQQTSITVYSNIGTPTVLLNGEKIEKIEQGYTEVHYILPDVTLKQGTNTIEAMITHQGETYMDKIEWNFTGEKERKVDSTENKDAHWGF